MGEQRAGNEGDRVWLTPRSLPLLLKITGGKAVFVFQLNFLFLNIVDSHAVVRSNMERSEST